MNAQDLGDIAPTPAMMAAFDEQCRDLHAADAMWLRVSTTDLSALNNLLAQHGKPAVKAPVGALTMPVCTP